MLIPVAEVGRLVDVRRLVILGIDTEVMELEPVSVDMADEERLASVLVDVLLVGNSDVLLLDPGIVGNVDE